MRDWLDKMMAVAGPAPAPAAYRSASTPAPSSAMTLREMYDPKYEVMRHPKWREQLLDREAHRRDTQTDVAEMVIALDEVLGGMRVFGEGDGDAAAVRCYMMSEMSGTWHRSWGPDYHDAYDAIVKLSDRMDRDVMVPLGALIGRQKTALHTDGELQQPREQDELQEEMLESEEHLSGLVELYGRLRTVDAQAELLASLLTERRKATREEGVVESEMSIRVE